MAIIQNGSPLTTIFQPNLYSQLLSGKTININDLPRQQFQNPYQNMLSNKISSLTGVASNQTTDPYSFQNLSQQFYGPKMTDYAQKFVNNVQPDVSSIGFQIGIQTGNQNMVNEAIEGLSNIKPAEVAASEIVPKRNVKSASFSDRFSNSTFGKNFGLWSAGLSMANNLFTGIAGPKSEYSGLRGHITQSMDSAYDAVQGAAGMFGPIGQVVSLGMGANKLLGNVANKLGAGTDGMTSTDAILGSSFLQLTPFGLVNGFGGKKADTITKDEQAFEQVGSSYGGTLATVDDALTKSGKKYGLFSSGARDKANREIAEAKRQQNIMSNIADDAYDRFAIAESTAAINGNRRQYYMQGGYNQATVRVGRSGMSLELMTKVRKILSNKDTQKFQQGGQIQTSPTEILLVVPEFQDGGQINKKSRTLQELIEYAKKENPRFIQRMSEPPRGIDFVDDEGKQVRGSHYMEWSTDDNGNAIIYPRIQEVDKELKFFNSSDAYNRAIENKNYLIMTPEEAKLFFAEDPKYGTAYKSGWPQFFGKFQQGGSINVIPEGALHARKHNMDVEGITKKGIPVVDNDGKQQAEIERSEIILRLEVTKKLEELEKEYYKEGTSKREKDEYAMEAGKLLVEELLHNTVDNTKELI